MRRIQLSILVFLMIASSLIASGPIRIMPLGNSISAGEHNGTPPFAERTGYRKDLYWMLTDAGFDVDFVGAEKHGERPESDPDWYDWNSECHPGWSTKALSDHLKQTWVHHKPDIILIHAGTNGNDWDDKPAQMMDLLDFLNETSIEYDHKMTIFLCKIINRRNNTDTRTTVMNDAVADLVSKRVDDQIKIIMIDMEKEAGIDYTDAPPDPTANPPYEGGDMYDLVHLNDKGNSKMAVMFYDAIIKELGESNAAIADYGFEEDASDATGNYNGTIENDATIVYDKKRGGNVLSLNDSGFVSLPPELANEMDDFSFAAWVNFAGTNPWAGLLGIGMSTGGTHPYWDFHLKSDNTIRFYSSVDGTWAPDGCAQKVINYTLPTREWTHVAFTFKKDSGAVVYINGAAQELEAWDGENDFSVSPSDLAADVFNLGKDSFNQTTLTNTLVDEIKFYKTALNELAVAAIYNGEKNLVMPNMMIARWQCDGDILDDFGMSNGVFYNTDAEHLVDSYIQQGQAMNFSGGTDSAYVEVADNYVIDFDSTTSFSASLILKVVDNDISGVMDILFKGATAPVEGTDKKGHWYSIAIKNNEIRFAVDDNVNKSQLALKDANLLWNVYDKYPWNHIVAVRDVAQDSLRLFLNGVQVASMKDMTDGDISTTHLPLIIGNGQNHDTKLNGLIDDVILYNYALDAAEVDALWKPYRIRLALPETAVEQPVISPLTYELKQNYPNPFNPDTKIEFQLKKTGQTKITVYNSMGQLVSTLLDKKLERGSHNLTVRLDNYSTGIYYYKIESGNFSQTRKMLLMK